MHSSLCRSCFKPESSGCDYCGNIRGAFDSAWHPCPVEGCTRSSFHCGACIEAAAAQQLRCRICWKRAGSKCIVCGKTDAQNAKEYMRCCKGCISGVSDAAHFNMVRSESDAYLERIQEQQCWSNHEPAFQLLLLPESSEPLPAYHDSPEYLDPSHCRLFWMGFQRGFFRIG